MSSNSLNGNIVNPNDGCGCPEGYDFINGECVKTETVPAVFTGNLVTVEKGDIVLLAYGRDGLRLYEDLSNYTLPLAGSGGFGTLYDNEGWATVQQGTPVISFLEDSVRSELWGMNTIIGGTSCSGAVGRLNEAGVRAPLTLGKADAISIWDNNNPSNLWIGLTLEQQLEVIRPAAIRFEFCIEVEVEKQYTIGIAADNEVIVSIDGQTAVYLGNRGATGAGASPINTAWFNKFHVFPLTLTPGTHTITLEGINDRFATGTTNFAFVAEIYDLTAQEIIDNFTDPYFNTPPLSCGNVAADIEPFILFSTKDYIGQEVPENINEGAWTCPEGGGSIDFCAGVPTCTRTIKADQLSCCYEIEACLNPGVFIEIQLDDSVAEALVVGNVYSFAGDPAIEDACFTVTKEIPCNTPTYTDVTIVNDYRTSDCTVCIPCYVLTNCKDETTLVIQWDPNSPPLNSVNTVYVFDFDPTACWTVQPSIPPCEGTLYDPTNIVDQYEDCDDCLAPCFRVIDCIDSSIVYTNSNLSAYIGQVISWNDGVENKCGTIEQYICIEDPQTLVPVTVLDCYPTCVDCLPKPPEPVPPFEPQHRKVKPGYDTPACTTAYVDKVSCKWSEAVYQYMATERFGLEFCCETDLRKWSIKKELLDIALITDTEIYVILFLLLNQILNQNHPHVKNIL